MIKAKKGISNASVEEYRLKYAAERFLLRLENSSYTEQFILKGGFLMEAIYNIDQRTTKDVDTLLRDISADKGTIENVLKDICSIDLNDDTKFTLTSLITTQEQRNYTGFRAKIFLQFLGEPTRINFDLDIGVGEIITPRAIKIRLPLLFKEKNGEKEVIEILSYPLQTILAEKLETVLTLGTTNSRMKDFYDIHLLLTDPNLPSIEECYEAFRNTWEFRQNNEFDVEIFDDWKFVLEDIIENRQINEIYWPNYVKNRNYAMNLKLSDIIYEVIRYVEELEVHSSK